MKPMLILFFYFFGCQKESIELSERSEKEELKLIDEGTKPNEVELSRPENPLQRPPEGDAAINNIDEREILAKLWYYAATTHQDQNEKNIDSLKTASLEAVKAEINLDKSPCFWLAYSHRLSGQKKKQDSILNECNFSKEAFLYFVEGPKDLNEIIHNFRETIESHQRILLFKQMKGNTCEFEGQQPLSTFTLKRDWTVE